MEAGRQLLPSPSSLLLPKTSVRGSLFSSVLMLHEQATVAVSSTTSITHHFPTSVLLQEQRDDLKSLLHTKDDNASQVTSEKGETDTDASEEKKSSEPGKYIKDFESQLLYWPGPFSSSSYFKENQLMETTTPVIVLHKDEPVGIELSDALSLAKKAVIASQEAASFAEESNLLDDNFAESCSGLESTSSTIRNPLENVIKVKSTRLLERKSKKRGVSKPKAVLHETPRMKMVDMHRKMNDGFDPNDPLRLFLSGSGTRQLLTAKEEKELFVQIQELARLEEVKARLQSQFGREPTIVEWAESVGISPLVLQSHLHSGQRSRERMTCANFRLVVHVAKQYLSWGMDLQDLLQEGSKGLMRSIEKFKPQAGCRFSTYAYWWIRQSIRKSLFQNSRTIRLPENVYILLSQVRNAKKQCIQEGHEPTNEELARRTGLSVEKLTSLLVSTRLPLSMQQPVWSDQDTTFQEITADTKIETPAQCVAKQLMRQHVRNFLNILSPKERRIIRLRFGIEDGQQNSLQQIGLIYGISKERVRQLESRALDKLKKCLSSQGLEAYAELLM